MDNDMINGLLTINLEPPYISFSAADQVQAFRSCGTEDIRKLLLSLKAISTQQHWPPCEYVLRLPGRFPRRLLAQFGLKIPAALPSVALSYNARLPLVKKRISS